MPARDGTARTSDRRSADDRGERGSPDCSVSGSARGGPELVRLWELWSVDQRGTPSAYVDRNETGWYDAGRWNVHVHPDEASAVADFIRRMAAWLSRREVSLPVTKPEAKPWPTWVRYLFFAVLAAILVFGAVGLSHQGVSGAVVRVVLIVVIVTVVLTPLQLLGVRRRGWAGGRFGAIR